MNKNAYNLKEQDKILPEKKKMLEFNKKKFNDRLELFLYFVQQDRQNFSAKYFLHSSIYYCRAALEEKLQRKFSIEEVREILKDKSWQTQCTSPQSLNDK